MSDLQNNNSTARANLARQIILMMGGGGVDIELDLDQDTLNLAIDLALSRYRQRSEHAVEESYLFMALKEGISDYTLPKEVIEVRQIFRKQFGVSINDSEYGAGQFDPFDLAYTNLYVLESGSTGGLATYDFYAQNIELAARMFGYHYTFLWNGMTRKLKINRNLRSEEEEIVLWIYNYIPEEMLIQDTYAGTWIRSYALAQAQLMLGKAYERFTSLAGPNGGVTLNGAQLQQDAKETIDKLEEEIKKYSEGSKPLGFIIG